MLNKKYFLFVYKSLTMLAKMACHFRKLQLPLLGLKIKINKEPNFYKMFIYILYIISTSNTNYKNTNVHNYTVDTIFVQVSSSLKLDGVLKAIKMN